MAEEKKENSEAKVESSTSAPSSKLPMILGLVNLLVTLGIGAVLFIQFQKDKKRESLEDIQVEGDSHSEAGEHSKDSGHGSKTADAGHEKPAEGAKDGHGASATPPGPKVVNLDQMTINLATSPGTPPRFARVVVAVEVPSEESAQEINAKLPVVKNSIIDLFNSKRPSDLQTGEGRNFLKEEIRNALNSYMVTGKVKGVYFSNFTISN